MEVKQTIKFLETVIEKSNKTPALHIIDQPQDMIKHDEFYNILDLVNFNVNHLLIKDKLEIKEETKNYCNVEKLTVLTNSFYTKYFKYASVYSTFKQIKELNVSVYYDWVVFFDNLMEWHDLLPNVEVVRIDVHSSRVARKLKIELATFAISHSDKEEVVKHLKEILNKIKTRGLLTVKVIIERRVPGSFDSKTLTLLTNLKNLDLIELEKVVNYIERVGARRR